MEKDFTMIVTDILKKNNEDITSDFLYHYTDGKSLQNIIEHSELWLSDRNYMNDILDEEYVSGLIKSKFAGIVNFKGSYIERNLFEKIPQYIFSTSLEKDLIHQWSYYSSTDAYCIEFDRHKLRDYLYQFKEKKDGFYFGPVIYSKEKAEQIITQVMDDYKKLLLEIIDSRDFDPHRTKMKNTAKDVYQYFFSLIKQYGHYCEKEFRFVFKTNRDPCFRTRSGLFVPYIKITKENVLLPITKIIIGPNNHEQIALQSLKKFLEKNKYGNIVVERSELNVRESK